MIEKLWHTLDQMQHKALTVNTLTILPFLFLYLYDIEVIWHIPYNLSTVKDFDLDILVQLTFIAVSGILLFYCCNDPLVKENHLRFHAGGGS